LSGGVKPTTAEERRWLKTLRLQQRGQVFFVVGFVGLLLLAIPAQGILRRFRILGAILSVAALCSWIGALVFSMWVGGKMLSEQNRVARGAGTASFVLNGESTSPPPTDASAADFLRGMI
jgi:hypothetical protein